MKRIIFRNVEELAFHMTELLAQGKDTTAVLFEKDALPLVKELASYEEVELCDLDIAKTEISGYAKEYYITLGADGCLFVEPAWKEDKYLLDGSNVVLIHGDANSAIIDRVGSCGSSELFEIDITTDKNICSVCGECCNDCTNCLKAQHFSCVWDILWEFFE